MSSIVPGPQKKIGEEIDAARSGAKPLDPSALNASAPRQEQLTGLEDWPESLRAAIEAEHARVAALDSNRRRTADKAVSELVRCLDTLLDEIADRLQADKPRLFGKSTPATEPSEEVAELLGIPSDELDQPSGRGEHRTALRTIKQLRGQLKDLETTPDHSRLTRLVTFIVRLAVVVESAPETATTLAPLALTRFSQGVADFQWESTFPEKLNLLAANPHHPHHQLTHPAHRRVVAFGELPDSRVVDTGRVPKPIPTTQHLTRQLLGQSAPLQTRAVHAPKTSTTQHDPRTPAEPATERPPRSGVVSRRLLFVVQPLMAPPRAKAPPSLRLRRR